MPNVTFFLLEKGNMIESKVKLRYYLAESFDKKIFYEIVFFMDGKSSFCRN